MPKKTDKLIELVGVPEHSVDEAVRDAITGASRSLRGVDWLEVTQIRGLIQDGQVRQFQVALKVGFRILEEHELRGSSGHRRPDGMDTTFWEKDARKLSGQCDTSKMLEGSHVAQAIVQIAWLPEEVNVREAPVYAGLALIAAA
ncbi:MAG TPA: dodecin [Chloroflexota bacterium]|jgi:hypothetical protein|nr:dodecin [Chloroflexota bacterium]